MAISSGTFYGNISWFIKTHYQCSFDTVGSFDLAKRSSEMPNFAHHTYHTTLTTHHIFHTASTYTLYFCTQHHSSVGLHPGLLC